VAFTPQQRPAWVAPLTLRTAQKEHIKSTDGRITRKKRREDYGDALKNSFTTVDADWTENVEDDPLVPMVHAIARAADKRKAGDITALRVSHLTVTTEFFVNMVGNSRPQNQAIAAAVEEELKLLGRTARHEGTADSGWILLDFGDVIVNVMTPRSREYYDIEAFWKDGQFLDLAAVLLPSLPSGPQPAGDEDADPFWGGDNEEDEALELTAEERDVAANGAELAADPDDEAEDADPFWDLGDGELAAPAAGQAAAKAAVKAAADEEDPFWS